MSFCESYDFFSVEFVFVDAWLDCMSEFWVHHIQEFVKFDGYGDLALQPFCNSINLYGGNSYPLYFSVLYLQYLIPLFTINVTTCGGDAMVLNALEQLFYGYWVDITMVSSLGMIIITGCIVYEIS